MLIDSRNPLHKPKFSILIVVYNGEKTIRRCIESLQAQVEKDFEVIVIDGNSKDDTLKIVLEYSAFLDCILSESDSGIQEAYNKALKLSRGELISFLSSDDAYLPHTLSSVLKEFNPNIQDQIIYGGMSYFDDLNEYVFVHHNELSKQMICHPSTFVNRKLFENYGYFDLNYKIAADYEIIARFEKVGANFFPIQKVLAIFQKGGASSQYKEICKMETLRVQKRYYDLGFIGWLYRFCKLTLASNQIFKSLSSQIKFWTKRVFKSFS
jgi:glycosyltransferase involved in cell wall biosynthesis